MKKIKAHVSILLAKLITILAGITGWPWPTKIMRRLTGTQLSVDQLLAIRNAIRKKKGCRLLIFGVGNDSLFWMYSNRDGRTVFLEDDEYWLRSVIKRVPGIEAYFVKYDSRIENWKEMIDSPDSLEMEMPSQVAATEWDVILVDAPAGWGEGTPGRMKSIYAASKLIAPDGDVFVHDCDREVEAAYCDRYLRPENLVEEIPAVDAGHLRHYRPRI